MRWPIFSTARRNAGIHCAACSRKEAGFELAELAKVQTQVTYEDGTRPDMAGYDGDGRKRLLVESKFWAALGSGQPGYIDQFDHSESAVLLFIAPEARTETLWAEICRQLDADKTSLEHTNLFAGPAQRQIVRLRMQRGKERRLDQLAAAAG